MSHSRDVHPFLGHDGPIAFAHRGGTTVAPENTVAAFEHAVSIGFRYLETDVHLTRDGVLVAFHDPDLQRTCGVDRRIAEMTSSEIESVRVGGEHRIPLMAELLERFPEARFNIDAKADDAVDPLHRLVTRFDALDRVCLAAFKLTRLRRLRSLFGAGVLTNTSPTEIASLRFAGRLPGRSQRAAQVPVTAGRLTVVNRRFVDAAHRNDVAVHVWTINERAEMERLLDLGVDGIMTDDPDLLKAVLVARGTWPT